MKHIYPFWLILLLCNLNSHAQNGHNHNFIVGGSAGYCNLIEDIQEINTLGSVGWTAFLGYEYKISNFLANISIEAQHLKFTGTFPLSGIDKMIYDTQGKKALMHYNFTEAHDTQRFLYTNIPIMAGYHYNGFFLSTGVKFGFCTISTDELRLSYSTSATYNQYIEDFQSMENHFYSNHTVKVQADLDSKYKFSVIAECGYDILNTWRNDNRNKVIGLKFSVYAEYGLNNIIQTNQEKPLYIVDEKDASKLNVVPFYLANSAKAHRTIPYYIGMRIALSFCIKTPNCNCNKSQFRP